jgi:hypothetical protein
MGFNGTFLLVSAERPGIRDRLRAVIERYFVDRGGTLVTRARLSCDSWREDTALVGIAIAPPVSGWIAIADTEDRPSAELARAVADALETPVVISSIAEICDPSEPEAITVFGAQLDDRFRNLYEVAGFRYRDLANPQEHFHPAPPFDPDAVMFLIVRGTVARTHYEDYGPADGDELPF